MPSMNKRQKRLCRALLDFYDASGAKPYPLAQLAKKTGCDPSDIYDKDSQSGDLWPFVFCLLSFVVLLHREEDARLPCCHPLNPERTAKHPRVR